MGDFSEKRVYEVLERGRDNDAAAYWVNAALMLLVVVNILAVIIASEHSIYLEYKLWFDSFEYFSVAIFSVEYLLRLWTAALNPQFEGSPWQRRRRYMLSLYGIVDLIAILPSILTFLIPGIDLRSLRAIRQERRFSNSRPQGSTTPRIVSGRNTRGQVPSVVPSNPRGATPTMVIG